MADAAVSMLMEPLISTIDQWIKEEISLIKNVKNKLKEVSSKLRKVQNVLDDAEKQSVTNESVKDWLDELKYISYEMDDVLDEWNTSLSKRKLEEAENPPDVPTEKISCSSFFTSCISPVKHVGMRRDIAWKIKDIDSRLDSVVKEIKDFDFALNQKSKSSVDDSLKTNRITNSIIKVSETYGRKFDEKIILSKLLAEGKHEVNRRIPIISIVGVGGLGKTTLAKLVFNNDEVVKSFSKRIWVCVSDPFDMNKTTREIVAAFGGFAPSDSSQDLLLRYLNELISNVRLLLVLDDVWDEEGKKWDDLRNCLESCAFGSRVIVTTRKEKVAKVMGSSTTNLHNLSQLSEEACWSLFSQIAFVEEKKDHEMLTRIGREIVKKCKGLPLAVRTLGNVLRFKNSIDEWERVLHSEIWRIEKVEVELFPHLYLSYNELTPALKKCFSYCSLFPKDTSMKVDDLTKFWMAQDYVTSTKGISDAESKGKEYFDKLATSCFFQDFENDDLGNIVRCKMHDIVHDFALYLTRNESITIENETQSSFSEKARHVNWPFLGIGYHPLTIREAVNLRSIFIHNYHLQQPISLISRLECVRSLVLKNCKLEKLPKEMGSLVHLRLLDLSYNWNLDELPESICELYNLQTLVITGCESITTLPETIGKLINLRHLFIGDVPLKNYPKSFERLTNLRTLKDFKVGRKFGKFEYLKKFKHLRGDLIIEIDSIDLEVTELMGDAEKAQLKNNKNIQYLKLSFEKDDAGIEAVWEALLPPTNLQRLEIANFFGTQYPSWLTNNSHFNNLKILYLENPTPNCSTLPPLWKLSCLETLLISENKSIKHIGREFFGIEDIVDSGDRSLNGAQASSSSSLVAFPKLVTLYFYHLEELEEWEDLSEEHDEPRVDTSNQIKILPRLRRLKIYGCRKLHQLPHRLLRKTSSLEYLYINKCGIFTDNEEDETESHRQQLLEQLLSHIPVMEIDLVIYTPDNPTGMKATSS